MDYTVQLDETIVSRFLNILKESRQDAIGFRYTQSNGVIAVGSTKYGGRPDVPAGFTWPEDEEKRPLSFLFQMNCAEVSPYDEKKLLPEKGLLSFFVQLDENIDWENMGKYIRVLYFDNPSLSRADFPEDLPEEFRVQEYSVNISRKDSYPDYEDLLDSSLNDGDFVYKQWEEYDAARVQLEPDIDEEDPELIATSLGYARLIQGSIVDDLESKVLLLQLFSDEKNPDGLLFGDVGALYFYISREDLSERRFDRITFEMQCY